MGDEDDRDYARITPSLVPEDLYGGDGRETWGRRAERDEVSRKMRLRKIETLALKQRLATMRKTTVTRAVVKEVVARQSSMPVMRRTGGRRVRRSPRRAPILKSSFIEEYCWLRLC